MPYPRFYGALKEMVRDELLETKTARDIARRAGVKSSGTIEAEPTGDVEVDLLQEFSRVTLSGTDHSQYGAYLPYRTAGNWFPPDGSRMLRYWDFTGVTAFRMTANITEPAEAGSVIYLLVNQESVVDPFRIQVTWSPGRPEVPADTVGFHDTGWCEATWGADTLEGRPGQAEWFLTNPTATAGSFGVGLVQLLIRREI